MCAGAIIQSRIDRVVFGTFDPKAWGDLSIEKLLQNPQLNHRVDIVSGVYKEEAKSMMKDFFKTLRSRNKKGK